MSEKTKISSSIHFLLNNQKELPLVMFYLRLRAYAANKGGYFIKYNFTHKERYVLLKKLRYLGWVDNYKIINHRFTAKYTCLESVGKFSGYFSDIPLNILKSKKKFNAYLTCIVETYIRRGQDNREKHGIRSWDYRERRFVRKQVPKWGREYMAKFLPSVDAKFSGKSFSFISRDMILGFRSITSKTVSNHRKILETDQTSSYTRLLQTEASHLAFYNNASGNDLNCYFSEKRKSFVKHLPVLCSSSIDLKQLNNYVSIIDINFTGSMGITHKSGLSNNFNVLTSNPLCQ